MEEYEFLTTMEEDNHCVLWKCVERATGRLVAVKGFKQAHTEPKYMRAALREARLLQALKHPAVLPLMDAFKTKTGRVYLVFPYVGRSALQELQEHPEGIPAPWLKLLVWQLLQALTYLHEQKVVHRDLKPGNLLLSEAGELRLWGFGFARATSCSLRGREQLSSYVTTRWYRAPEALVGDEYGPSSDIWSLGCTLAELATAMPLFPGKSTGEQLWRIMRCFGPLPTSQAECMAGDPRLGRVKVPARGRLLRERLRGMCEPALLRLIEACLHLDPRRRPTAAELLTSSFFSSVPKLLAGTSLEYLYRDQQPGAQQQQHNRLHGRQQEQLHRGQRAEGEGDDDEDGSPPVTPRSGTAGGGRERGGPRHWKWSVEEERGSAAIEAAAGRSGGGEEVAGPSVGRRRGAAAATTLNGEGARPFLTIKQELGGSPVGAVVPDEEDADTADDEENDVAQLEDEDGSRSSNSSLIHVSLSSFTRKGDNSSRRPSQQHKQQQQRRQREDAEEEEEPEGAGSGGAHFAGEVLKGVLRILRTVDTQVVERFTPAKGAVAGAAAGTGSQQHGSYQEGRRHVSQTAGLRPAVPGATDAAPPPAAADGPNCGNSAQQTPPSGPAPPITPQTQQRPPWHRKSVREAVAATPSEQQRQQQPASSAAAQSYAPGAAAPAAACGDRPGSAPNGNSSQRLARLISETLGDLPNECPGTRASSCSSISVESTLLRQVSDDDDSGADDDYCGHEGRNVGVDGDGNDGDGGGVTGSSGAFRKPANNSTWETQPSPAAATQRPLCRAAAAAAFAAGESRRESLVIVGPMEEGDQQPVDTPSSGAARGAAAAAAPLLLPAAPQWVPGWSPSSEVTNGKTTCGDAGMVPHQRSSPAPAAAAPLSTSHLLLSSWSQQQQQQEQPHSVMLLTTGDIPSLLGTAPPGSSRRQPRLHLQTQPSSGSSTPAAAVAAALAPADPQLLLTSTLSGRHLRAALEAARRTAPGLSSGGGGSPPLHLESPPLLHGGAVATSSRLLSPRASLLNSGSRHVSGALLRAVTSDAAAAALVAAAAPPSRMSHDYSLPRVASASVDGRGDGGGASFTFGMRFPFRRGPAAVSAEPAKMSSSGASAAGLGRTLSSNAAAQAWAEAAMAAAAASPPLSPSGSVAASALMLGRAKLAAGGGWGAGSGSGRMLLSDDMDRSLKGVGSNEGGGAAVDGRPDLASLRLPPLAAPVVGSPSPSPSMALLTSSSLLRRRIAPPGGASPEGPLLPSVVEALGPANTSNDSGVDGGGDDSGSESTDGIAAGGHSGAGRGRHPEGASAGGGGDAARKKGRLKKLFGSVKRALSNRQQN